MKFLLVTALAALALAVPANAAFQVGIADPGSNGIGADVSALGISVERQTVVWQGEASFSGSITWDAGLRQIVAVSSGYPAFVVPTDAATRSTYCGFVASILERYRSITDVVIWNEPNLSGFWGAGVDQYAQLVAACSPVIHSLGVRVLAPGMSPATVESVSDYADHIAALGPHLIDGWDQHEYDEWTPLTDKVAAIRAAFGWKVPVMVDESSDSNLMGWAYCSGASGWLNFKLRDDGSWSGHPTGLETSTGARKSSWDAFRTTAARIHAGTYSCPSAPPAAPPATHHWTPNEKRAQRLGEVGGWARDAYEAGG